MIQVSEAAEKLAKILRVDKDEILLPAALRLEEVTGKKGVLEAIVEEMETKLAEKLMLLNVGRNVDIAEIYDALISRIEADDLALYELLRRPNYADSGAYKTILGFAREFSRVGEGFFIKHEKARELLSAKPPERILDALGYKTVEELLAQEDLLEIFAALRFLEDPEWLNNVFIKQYESLTRNDFEKRSVEIRVLSPKWQNAAERFLQKKHHNVSHLKELGVIFVIPWSLGVSGETLRLLAMLLHYMHEIEFYSKLFERFSKHPESFVKNLVAALRGNLPGRRPDDVDRWLIIQRYLAKDDPNDWRLLWPHVNPEALHWQKAESDLIRIGTHFNIPGLLFWGDLDWLGEFFPTEAGIEILASFDLVDTVMSLVKRRELHKYLYHQQEALWNKIFSAYVGVEEMHELIVDNFEDHEIKISKIGYALRKIKSALAPGE